MAPWLESGFWNSGDGNKFASFMLSVALHLERPVAVIERKGKTFLNPVRIYGARNANGALIHSTAKPNVPETVPTFKLVLSWCRLPTWSRRCAPTPDVSCSVVEFNGSNHLTVHAYKPGLKVSLRTGYDVAVMGEHDSPRPPPTPPRSVRTGIHEPTPILRPVNPRGGRCGRCRPSWVARIVAI